MSSPSQRHPQQIKHFLLSGHFPKYARIEIERKTETAQSSAAPFAFSQNVLRAVEIIQKAEQNQRDESEKR
jgi:hypothetical protein